MILRADIIAALQRAGLDGPLLVAACYELEALPDIGGRSRESGSHRTIPDSNGPATAFKDEQTGLQSPDRTVVVGGPIHASSSVKAVARAALLTTPGLRPGARRVGGVLVECFNLGSGRCDPSNGYISEKTGLSERSVRRAIGQLEDAGLLQRRIHGGRHNTNAYDLKWDALAGMAQRAGNRAKPDSMGSTRTLVAAEPDARVRQNLNLKQIDRSVDVVRPLRASIGRRPNPRQREMLMVMPSTQMAVAFEEAVKKRVSDDVTARLVAHDRAELVRVYPMIPLDLWDQAYAVERQQRGTGWQVALDGVQWTGPPRTAVGG